MADDPLLTGRFTHEGDCNGDAQRNGVWSGTGVYKIGTWDLSGAVPVFVPSPPGGKWAVKWEARMNLDGSAEDKFGGHGIAEEVEGMQFDLAGRWQGPAGGYEGQILDPHAQE